MTEWLAEEFACHSRVNKPAGIRDCRRARGLLTAARAQQHPTPAGVESCLRAEDSWGQSGRERVPTIRLLHRPRQEEHESEATQPDSVSRCPQYRGEQERSWRRAGNMAPWGSTRPAPQKATKAQTLKPHHQTHILVL